MNAALVFLGGGLGALLRWGIARLITVSGWNHVLPVQTILANLVSVGIMGLVLLGLAKSAHDEAVRSFWLLGFCGGLSTFSTFSLENVLLVRAGQWEWAVANILISVAACFAVLWLYQKNF